jgi:adenosine deaminase
MRVDARSQRKAELHCHIDGLLDPAMLDELARGGEPLAIDPAALGTHHPVRSVGQWLDGYGALVGPATQPHDRWLPRMLEIHLTRLRAQNVVYTEIYIEFCPSSNLALGVVRRIDDHPIARAHELGLSFSINTDDPGPFACSMTSELELVADTFGFGAADLARIFDHTMQAAFADR